MSKNVGQNPRRRVTQMKSTENGRHRSSSSPSFRSSQQDATANSSIDIDATMKKQDRLCGVVDKLKYDMTCFTLIVTPLITALVNAVIANMHDALFWAILKRRGHVLFTWTSLLTNCNDELQMLTDFSAAVAYVNSFLKFRFSHFETDPYPALHEDLTGLLHVHIPVPSVDDAPYLANFLQTCHNIVFGCKVILVNHEVITAPNASAALLPHDFRLQKQLLESAKNEMLLESKLAKECAMSDIENKCGDAKINLVSTIDSLRTELVQEVDTPHLTCAEPSKNSVKHLHLLHRLAREIRAIRLTSCKSAKDRSSVSCTYEAAQMLLEKHPNVMYPMAGKDASYSSQPISNIANVLREEGVRLRNCRRNVGNSQYKFTQMNFNCLPDEYKPPRQTYCESKDVKT